MELSTTRKKGSLSYSIASNGLDFFSPAPPPGLLEPKDMHDYQGVGVDHMLINEDGMLWLGMGLGKTIISLTAIVDRINSGQVKKVLIWGPLRVIQSVWAEEARKWTHTRHLRFSLITGSPEQRARAMFANADIYLCNYENMNWLADKLQIYCLDADKPIPYDWCIYDEISKMKNSTSLRMKGGIVDVKDGRGGTVEVRKIGWRKFVPLFKYHTGLTGTPASNGYIDLHGQYLAVDNGKRLGPYITGYRDAYFESDHMGWKYSPTIPGKEWIERKISDITLKMDTRDYLDMPECVISDVMVPLPPKARKHYEQLEQDLFTELDSGREVELFSKNSVSNKLLQVCNGQLYLNQEIYSEGYEAVHSAKLDALGQILEQAAGSPVLCSYTFRSDAERIMKKFGKQYNAVNLTDEKSVKTAKIIEDWNAGRIQLLLGHPASMGHGVDRLQESGNIVVWFGINWSLELYLQLIARIDRQGQTKPVSVLRILCEETIDLAVADAIETKTDNEEGLKAAIQRYRDKKVRT